MKSMAREWLQKLKWPLSAALSFLTCVGINGTVFRNAERIFSNSIFSLIVFFVLIPVYASVLGGRDTNGKIKLMHNKRSFFCSAVCGAVFSVCMVFGERIASVGSVNLLDGKVYLSVLFLLPLFTLLMAWLNGILSRITEQKTTMSLLIKKSLPVANGHYFLIIWLIIVLCWLPVFFAAYPGVYRYDAYYQLEPLIVYNRLSGHHPVIHTLFLYASLMLGNRLFGSYEAGLAIYSIVQILVMSAVFAYSCYYLARRRAPRWIQLFAVAYFALFPFNGVMAVSATKDSLFSAFFLLAVLLTADLVEDPKRFCTSPLRMIRYIFALVFMCMWRNNGFYILIVFLPILVIALRQYWKRLVPISLAVIFLYLGYSGPLMQAIGNYAPGDFRETMSVPMQQIARTVKYYGDELTPEELEAIGELIDPEYLDQYNPRLSDPVKSGFQTNVLKENPAKYLKLYFKLGLKYPGVYLDAFLNVSLGNWYPDLVYPDNLSNHLYIEYAGDSAYYKNFPTSDRVMIPERESKFEWLETRLISYTEETTQQNIPVLSMLINSGFIFFLIVATCEVVLYFKRYRRLLPLLLLLGLWGTTMLGPIALFRYSYPLMICTPFLLWYIRSCVREPEP